VEEDLKRRYAPSVVQFLHKANLSGVRKNVKLFSISVRVVLAKNTLTLDLSSLG
jgi:hypothetical protein